MKTSFSSTIRETRSAKKSDASALQRESRVRSTPGPATRPRRILLVDDDPGVRGSLSDVLVIEGYVVIPANDGQQAIELAGSIPLDLVLLDLNMPRRNGWDTFGRLTADQPFLPVIIVTARPNQLFTAVAAGVGALLEKPLDIPALLHTIKRLLAEPAATRLARSAGREAEFHYNPGHSPQRSKASKD